MSNHPASVSPALVRRRRLMLLGVIALFVLPVIGARFYYQHVVESGGPLATTNQGVLIQPARPLDGLPLQDLEGKLLDNKLLQGMWTLIHIEKAECDPVCQDNLYKTRQIRVALNKDTSRVQRLLILLGEHRNESVEPLRRLHPQLLLASVEEARIGALLQAFEVEGKTAVTAAQRVYLVDPLGNLMMWYPPGQEPKGILRDLQKLLKVSQIG